MKRFLIFLFFNCLFLIGLLAVPAKPVVVVLTQPDGSELEVMLRGDELCHYYETFDGKIVVQNEYGWYEVVDDVLRVADNRERAKVKRVNSLRRAPHQAERGLVILVEFTDKKFVKRREDFYNLLNKEGYNYNGATGSARDYFKSASNGQYVPEFDVYGPYQLDKIEGFYGRNDMSGNDVHPDQMVVDAVAKLAGDSTVDVNFADYDTDNDGNIDNIFVYYAGYGENEGAPASTIWPHAWEVYEQYVTGELIYDGKTIRGYACTSELQNTSDTIICGIGTFCHEFGHVLGLPDFYVTDYSSNHRTLGYWDIMDSGSYLNEGNTPPTYSAYERFYLGWLIPENLNASGDFYLEDLKKSNKAYIITPTREHNFDGAQPSPNVFYLLENRQKYGWDRYLPGHGMMISKVMFDEQKWMNNIPNNDKNTMGCDIIEAGGDSLVFGYGTESDLFPGSFGVAEFRPDLNSLISNIVESDSVITFTFKDDYNGVLVDVLNSNDRIVLVDCNGVCSLLGVEYGSEVCCYNSVGRLLWRKIVKEDVMTFNEPIGFYLLKIFDGDNVAVVKGLGY